MWSLGDSNTCRGVISMIWCVAININEFQIVQDISRLDLK